MSQIDCNACQDLKTNAPNFVANGVGDTECASLAADTGLNQNLSPQHNDATDLHDVNDCLIGSAVNDLEGYDVCDWQDFMKGFIPNIYETIKGGICSLGGAWTYIHNLLGRVGSLETRMTNAEGDITNLKTRMSTAEGNISTINNRIDEIIAAMGGDEDEIPVMKRYRYTVPAEAFTPVWRTDDGSVYNNGSWSQTIPNGMGIVEWFSGGGNNQQVGEMWIRVPVSEMDSITGVWTQSWVVPSGNTFDGRGKAYMQSVNVQEWYRSGDYLIVNFDTYILAPQRFTAEQEPTNPQNGGPYPVTVDFLVVGKKTIST